MSQLRIESVFKKYGTTQVLNDISLEVPDKALSVFVGPSGCGKSTLLRIIAGLEDISSGRILIDDRIVNELPPHRRDIAMVFQNYALYPHMTVHDNMAYWMKTAGLSKQEVSWRVNRAAKILQIEPYLNRRPAELSGGQRQRVAIGRAITRDPKVFLFDEPLSNLDAELRLSMRVEIAKLHREIGATTVFVTHDQVEAMTLADQIVVMNQGRIEQIGTPEEIYRKPANQFVAGFIGSPRMNFIPGKLISNNGQEKLQLPSGMEFKLGSRIPHPAPRGRDILLGIRPEALRISKPAGPGTIEAKVIHSEYLGGANYIYLEADQLNRGNDTNLVVVDTADTRPLMGERVGVDFETSDLHLFGEDGKALSCS